MLLFSLLPFVFDNKEAPTVFYYWKLAVANCGISWYTVDSLSEVLVGSAYLAMILSVLPCFSTSRSLL